jgi:hypothetical protein
MVKLRTAGGRRTMEIKAGDVAIHKATGKKMVVIGVISDALVMCRYQNEVTARYEAQEFFKHEFTIPTPEAQSKTER